MIRFAILMAVTAILCAAWFGLARLLRLLGDPLRRLVAWMRPVAPLVLALLVLFGDIAVDALGAFDLSDRADETSNRAAGLVSGPFYGLADRPGQRAIVIIALDDDFIRRSGGVWPVSYGAAQGLLEEIVAAKPRAIFWDSYYSHPHVTAAGWPDVGGVRSLAAVMAAARVEGAPVLVGPVAADQPLLAPLAASAEQVGLASDDSRPFAYSLFGRDGRKMAALRLYEIWAAREAPDRKPPALRSLSLDWGFGASEWMGQRLDKGASPCIAPDIWSRMASFMGLAWRAIAPNLNRDTDVAEGLVVACPYFDMVPAAWAAHPVVRERLKDSIVLVGATAPWLRDQASAPLLGEVPGVMVHAMALDNLIQSGASATRYPVQYDRLLKLDQSDFVQAALLLLGFAAVWVMHGAFGYPDSEPLPLKVKLAIWGGVAWLGVAIACLSHWPMFKLVTAALAGGVCLQAWDEFLKRWRPETEGETS